MSETNCIVLHGRLKQRFGGPFNLGVSTPAQAFRTLMMMKPGFRQEIEKGAYRIIRGPKKSGVALDEPMLHMKLGWGNELHIVPVAKGAKNGGVGKVILGAVLVVAAVALAQPEFLFGAGGVGWGGTALWGAITYGQMALFGGMMILGGVSMLLSPQQKTDTGIKSDKNDGSFLLSGNLNSTQQGAPIPLVYGKKMRVGSIVVSAGYTAVDLQSNPADPSSTIIDKLKGGRQ